MLKLTGAFVKSGLMGILFWMLVAWACSRPPVVDSTRQTVEQSQQTSAAAPTEEALPEPPKSVKGYMQARPGGPVEEVEVAVHQVPVDLPALAADEAPLSDDDLVLGVVVKGQAMAYPIRYLAMHEIVDDHVGDTPLAPTW